MNEVARDFQTDLRDASWMIERQFDQWQAGSFWKRIRASIAGEGCFRVYRDALEARLTSFHSTCSLDLRNGWRTYTHHPVAAFPELRAMNILAHLDDEQITEAILGRMYRGGYYAQSIEDRAPRVSLPQVLEHIQRKYGFLCQSCRRPKSTRRYWGDPDSENDFGETGCPFPAEDIDDTPEHQWLDLGWCDACLAAARVGRVLKGKKNAARERVFMSQVRMARAAKEAANEALQAQRAESLRKAREARLLKQAQMEAAYELVRDLGLLENRNASGEAHEASNSH